MPYSRRTLNRKYGGKYRSGSSAKGSFGGYQRTDYRAKRIYKAAAASRAARKALQGVQRLNRMIETKELSRLGTPGVAIAHNNIYIQVDNNTGSYLNPFYCNSQGAADPMAAGNGQRIGDKISVKGVMIRGFLENQLSRPKVWWRAMLIKTAKGDLPTRVTLFKGDSSNKMIDQVNTERYTIVAQKIFNIQSTNTAPTGVSVAGVPTGETGGGNPTRTFKMWIPGTKFSRTGDLTYEDGSSGQLKFFDYYLIWCCYDWYGTPQDVNNVGKINEVYSKVYFKDA